MSILLLYFGNIWYNKDSKLIFGKTADATAETITFLSDTLKAVRPSLWSSRKVIVSDGTPEVFPRKGNFYGNY